MALEEEEHALEEEEEDEGRSWPRQELRAGSSQCGSKGRLAIAPLKVPPATNALGEGTQGLLPPG